MRIATTAENYNFRVQGENSLLDAAGRRRGAETDHVVELQLVVAAISSTQYFAIHDLQS